ncbi:hypothetical protein B0H19DRAFT_1265042 [Mycena capillaripes]|nr:hypothetical protein B0H19DRAFT_1265042 [Mycena capillaripes]
MDSPPQGPIDPRLPPELERIVFEIAALSRPTEILNLLLTAHRVKAWVEPILYRYPTPTVHILRQAIETKSRAFFQHTARHLFLGGSGNTADFEIILTACSQVTNLFDRPLPKSLVVFDAFQFLRRLAISQEVLMRLCGGTELHPIFRNVAHLEPFDISNMGQDVVFVPQVVEVPRRDQQADRRGRHAD